MSDNVSIRVRLSRSEVEDVEAVRQFLGLPSLSAAFARLGLWNAHILAQSLRNESPAIDAIGDVVGESTRMAVQTALHELMAR